MENLDLRVFLCWHGVLAGCRGSCKGLWRLTFGATEVTQHQHNLRNNYWQDHC